MQKPIMSQAEIAESHEAVLSALASEGDWNPLTLHEKNLIEFGVIHGVLYRNIVAWIIGQRDIAESGD